MTVIVHKLLTNRLLLHQGARCRLAPFTKITANPDVMQYFPKLLSVQETHALADKIRDLISRQGWGLWAVELRS